MGISKAGLKRRRPKLAQQGVPSLSEGVMPPSLNWSVMWIKDYRVVEKWCGDDFAEALRLYDVARESGRTAVTLRCANYAFPPPERLRKRQVPVVVVKKVGGKTKRFRGYKTEHKLRELNARGILWCPYCIKLRRFEKQKGFRYEGRFVSRPGYYCPVCGTFATSVKRWNPLWYKYEVGRRIRKPNTRTKRTRARTR